jgi:hypothetical protein
VLVSQLKMASFAPSRRLNEPLSALVYGVSRKYPGRKRTSPVMTARFSRFSRRARNRVGDKGESEDKKERRRKQTNQPGDAESFLKFFYLGTKVFERFAKNQDIKGELANKDDRLT